MQSDLLINFAIKVKPYEKVNLIYRKDELNLPKVILGSELKLWDRVKIRSHQEITIQKID